MRQMPGDRLRMADHSKQVQSASESFAEQKVIMQEA
jgi:hypothetical protein